MSSDTTEEPTKLLDTVDWGAPILTRTRDLVRTVEAVGFGWPNAEAVLTKVREELHEVEVEVARADAVRAAQEVGDLLFAVCCLAHQLEIDAEAALDGTLRKFRRRFDHVERRARERAGGLAEVEAGGLEVWWQEAKWIERGSSVASVAPGSEELLGSGGDRRLDDEARARRSASSPRE